MYILLDDVSSTGLSSTLGFKIETWIFTFTCGMLGYDFTSQRAAVVFFQSQMTYLHAWPQSQVCQVHFWGKLTLTVCPFEGIHWGYWGIRVTQLTFYNLPRNPMCFFVLMVEPSKMKVFSLLHSKTEPWSFRFRVFKSYISFVFLHVENRCLPHLRPPQKLFDQTFFSFAPLEADDTPILSEFGWQTNGLVSRGDV